MYGDSAIPRSLRTSASHDSHVCKPPFFSFFFGEKIPFPEVFVLNGLHRGIFDLLPGSVSQFAHENLRTTQVVPSSCTLSHDLSGS